jgi:hypothetical protein
LFSIGDEKEETTSFWSCLQEIQDGMEVLNEKMIIGMHCYSTKYLVNLYLLIVIFIAACCMQGLALL